MTEKIKALFEESQKLNYDGCCGMVAVNEMRGPGFFPGCNGLYSNDSQSVERTVMIVGQDFDTEENHLKIDKINGEVNSNKTWHNLKTLLKAIAISENSCFFTNVYMGLRKDRIKNTGSSPAKKSRDFVKQCRCFFKKQLTVINPDLVLVLGVEPAKFLLKTYPLEFAVWKKITPLKKFYDQATNLSCTLNFNEKDIKFVFVIHPSMNKLNRSIIWKDIEEKETGYLKELISSFTLPTINNQSNRNS